MNTDNGICVIWSKWLHQNGDHRLFYKHHPKMKDLKLKYFCPTSNNLVVNTGFSNDIAVWFSQTCSVLCSTSYNITMKFWEFFLWVTDVQEIQFENVVTFAICSQKESIHPFLLYLWDKYRAFQSDLQYLWDTVTWQTLGTHFRDWVKGRYWFI